MIIGYWSEVPFKGAVTYNMIATALSMSAVSDKRFILMQCKADYNRIDYAFTPYMEDNIMREDYGYYDYGGIDTVVNKLENHVFNIEDVLNELVRVRDSNLYYLPSTRMGVNGMFERRFYHVSERYIKSIKRLGTEAVIMLELCSGFEHITDHIFDMLDLLVINIAQENNALGGIRNRRGVMEKSVFIIGRYDDASEFSIRNIYRRYHIDEDAIGAVPYNVRFKDSVCLGRSKEFFDRNERVKRDNDNYTFMKYLRATSDMIMKRCSIGVYR